MADCNYWRQKQFGRCAASFPLLSFAAHTDVLSISMNSFGHKYIIRRLETAVGAIFLTTASCGCCFKCCWVFAIWGAHHIYKLVYSLNMRLHSLYIISCRLLVCFLHIYSTNHNQPSTHSLPMVVFSSFASFMGGGLCSVAAGVSSSTSTMAGSACGRIPLQRKIQPHGQTQCLI